jgi:hypothetical protein
MCMCVCECWQYFSLLSGCGLLISDKLFISASCIFLYIRMIYVKFQVFWTFDSQNNNFM